MDFLAWLESTFLAVWVRESISMLAYPTVITLHTVGLAILVGGHATLALRLLGVAPGIPLAPLAVLFPLMYAGFAINLVTGVGLFVAGATVFGTMPLFYVKMLFVALGVINVRLLQNSVFHNPGGLEQGNAPGHGRILAGAALVIWAVAITAGRYTAYV